jgi:hypothetical protein
VEIRAAAGYAAGGVRVTHERRAAIFPVWSDRRLKLCHVPEFDDGPLSDDRPAFDLKPKSRNPVQGARNTLFRNRHDVKGPPPRADWRLTRIPLPNAGRVWLFDAPFLPMHSDISLGSTHFKRIIRTRRMLTGDTPSNSVRPPPNIIHERGRSHTGTTAQHNVAPVYSIYAGMSRTTSVNLLELIS